ncbi:MAG: AAC(3) family N-acetyltransferase [Chloroflexi bacterium]|nr:AAC(3) family N-acetyltransferase [Chloroflexota bacterium]
MLQYRDIRKALDNLHIQRGDPAVVHISASLVPQVRGGAQTILGALLAGIDNLLMPSFTYKTMIIPEVGPADNLIDYGSGRIENLNAAIFTSDLPADFEDREISEVFRHYPDVTRSNHPILSFLGLGLDAALSMQSVTDPYGHIAYLRGKGAKILLMAKDAPSIFSLHLAIKQSGRKQFTRWALTSEGIQECQAYPGCANGFHKLFFYIGDQLKQIQVQEEAWYALPLDITLEAAERLIKKDPYALLCNDLQCEKCNLIRKEIRQSGAEG